MATHHQILIGTEGEIFFKKYPDLTGKIISFKNSLCPSNWNKNIKCIWEGYLEVVLMLNGEKITLNNHDQKRNKVSLINGYKLQGLGPIIDGEKVYLKFSVEKL